MLLFISVKERIISFHADPTLHVSLIYLEEIIGDMRSNLRSQKYFQCLEKALVQLDSQLNDELPVELSLFYSIEHGWYKMFSKLSSILWSSMISQGLIIIIFTVLVLYLANAVGLNRVIFGPRPKKSRQLNNKFDNQRLIVNPFMTSDSSKTKKKHN